MLRSLVNDFGPNHGHVGIYTDGTKYFVLVSPDLSQCSRDDFNKCDHPVWSTHETFEEAFDAMDTLTPAR